MNMAGKNIIRGDKLPENILPQEVDDILAECTFEGKWELVVEMYQRFPEKAPTVKIRDSIGTALHVAVEVAKEKVVEDLVKAIVNYGHEEEEVVLQTPEEEERRIRKALTMTDERGNTPLHVAASRGLPRICKCIVEEKGKRLDLVRVKNNEGETPLFVAAVTGNKTAFAYLSDVSEEEVNRDDLVRKGGDSILHLTIRREIFDLAVIILDKYEFLGTHANDKGFTPLSVLATRPSGFRSGSTFSWWRLILYHCIDVEPVDVTATMRSLLSQVEPPRDEKKYPPVNYDTICSFLKLLKATLFGILFYHGSIKDDHGTQDPEGGTTNKNTVLPPNYATPQQFLKSAYVHAIGLSGTMVLRDIRKTRKRHRWSRQLLEALLKNPYEAFTGRGGIPRGDWDVDADMYAAFGEGELPTDDGIDSDPYTIRRQRDQQDRTKPPLEAQSQKETEGAKPNEAKEPQNQNQKDSEEAKPNEANDTQNQNQKDSKGTILDDKTTSALLLAARNGISEMVTMILSKIPSAIHDTTEAKKKNVLLVAVSNRQTLVVKELKKLNSEHWPNLARAVDADENTLLHLAADAQGEDKPWQISGSALQMMWDIKWFEYIKDNVPYHFKFRSNRDEKTAGEIFNKTHHQLVIDSSEWLKDTSESCSVVAALVAGVSFATAGTVPGGTNNGHPILEGQPAFDAFAVSSLIGLCSSVTGLIMFLAILTSRKEARDFRRGLPFKLLLGLSSLFVSIVAMFVSFCSGHVYIVNHKYVRILFPFYAATALPVAFYAMAQFPLYFDLLTAILTKLPRGRDKARHV